MIVATFVAISVSVSFDWLLWQRTDLELVEPLPHQRTQHFGVAFLSKFVPDRVAGIQVLLVLSDLLLDVC